MNGTDVIVKVNTGTVLVPVWTAVGKQRGAKHSEKNSVIDTSSKDARERSVEAGRYESTVTLDALYVPTDTAFEALQTACRDGALVLIQRAEDGVAIEKANAVVSTMDSDFPDQDAATISATFEISGAWTAAA